MKKEIFETKIEKKKKNDVTTLFKGLTKCQESCDVLDFSINVKRERTK